jgi:hypothetical protein
MQDFTCVYSPPVYLANEANDVTVPARHSISFPFEEYFYLFIPASNDKVAWTFVPSAVKVPHYHYYYHYYILFVIIFIHFLFFFFSTFR